MRNIWKSTIVRWGLPLAWMVLIFCLSAQSNLPSLTPGAPGLQEIAGHFTIFAVLSWLLWRALNAEGVRNAGLWVMLVALLYGISDEFHQSFVPGRDASINDWLVDAAGVMAALVVVATVRRLTPRRPPPPAPAQY